VVRKPNVYYVVGGSINYGNNMLPSSGDLRKIGYGITTELAEKGASQARKIVQAAEKKAVYSWMCAKQGTQPDKKNY